MSRPLLSGHAAPGAWAPRRRTPRRPALLHWLRQLLLLLCAVAAVAVFVLTLMVPGMSSPRPARDRALPASGSGEARQAAGPPPSLARCQAHQAIFLC